MLFTYLPNKLFIHAQSINNENITVQQESKKYYSNYLEPVYDDEYDNWITKNILSIDYMAKSKDLLSKYHFFFDGDGVRSFRIFVSTINTGDDNNKGRVVIRNLDLFY